MDKVNNIIYYIILLALFGFCAYFLHNYYLSIVFIMLLVFPFFTFIAGKLTIKALSLRIMTESVWVDKNKETFLYFIFKNKSIMPVLNCTIKFRVENKFFPNNNLTNFNLSLPCLCEYKSSLPIKPTQCGMVTINVDSIEINDLLNIFSFSKKTDYSYCFNVIPDYTKGIFSLSPSELYSEDSLILTKNVNGTQIDGIRDYIAGDKLRNIHWKLSSKHNELLVKEYSDNNEETAVLLVELFQPAIDDIIDNSFGIAKALLKNNYPFTIAFATAGSEQLIKIFVNDTHTLNEAIEKIYLSYPTNADNTSLFALRREYAGSGIIYVHGGNDKKAVIDII